MASQEAKAVFKKNPVGASLSGLGPRLVGVGFKRIPKFGFLLATQFLFFSGGDPGMVSATVASICSAPFINPIRMIEKQQRAYFKQTGASELLLCAMCVALYLLHVYSIHRACFIACLDISSSLTGL